MTRSGQAERDVAHLGQQMNSQYKNPGFHPGGVHVPGEPGAAPLNDPSVPYGFHPLGHMDPCSPSLPHLQHPPQMHTFVGGHQPHLGPPQGHHPHLQHSQFGGSYGATEMSSSCLHGGRLEGFQQGFTEGFDPLSVSQAGEGFSHRQPSAAIPDFQHHGPGGNHVVPAPCLPLDQSPNRAASFHGLPSFSSEPHSLDPHEPNCHVPHYGMGRPAAGDGGSHGNPGVPRQGVPKAHQLQHATFYERFGGGRKVPVGEEPGLTARYSAGQQPQPGGVARQGPCPSALVHSPGSGHNGMRDGGLMMPVQHGQFDYPFSRTEGRSVHPYEDPAFGMQPQPPPSQRLQHFDSACMNVSKRPRFDFSGGPNEEGCGNWGNGLHTPPGGSSHLSPSAYPAPTGNFTPAAPEGFSLLSAEQVSLQQRHNAALMMKQMASRSQQHRTQQSGLRQICHPGDLGPSNMAPRGQMGAFEGSSFENDGVRRMANVDSQKGPTLQEIPWCPTMAPQGDILPCRLGGAPRPHDMGLQQGSGDVLFRPGTGCPGMGVQEPTRMSHNRHTQGHAQALLSPGVHSQLRNNTGELQQMQSPDMGVVLPNAAAGRRPTDFSTPHMGSQPSFPFGGTQRQGTAQNIAPGTNSSPGSYQTRSEMSTGQGSSLSKLGSLSLGSFSKSSGKDSAFGESCLAALSTACQNMIASLGAPNLNVTFNRKGPNQGRRKAGPAEQDVGCAAMSGVGECFQGDVKENPPGGEGRGGPVCGRGRGRRKSGQINPGGFFPSDGGNAAVTPSPSSGEKLQEESLKSPSWRKGDDLLLGDQTDLMSSLDAGTQSVARSNGSSPHADFPGDGSAICSNEDEVSSSSDHSKPVRSLPLPVSPKQLRSDQRVTKRQKPGGVTVGGCSTSTPDSYTFNGPGTPVLEPVRVPTSAAGQDEIHPLDILQAQIQLQRQQFSISEDGARTDSPSQNGDTGPSPHCSPDGGKAPVDPIDLDSLMAEQNAAWFVPGNKALVSDQQGDKRTAPWEKSGSHSNCKEGWRGEDVFTLLIHP
ncbi:putative tumor suppressor protein MN1 [Scleropages formosus]|uniref:Putative tumor suppressor protein MN1 n=1 Tax=Scleropages formosus TaxID=113540 RepID=A0A0P7UXW8_SCLFO|nr:putative tumor suppressor protein MN1 [Scleropages formosus]